MGQPDLIRIFFSKSKLRFDLNYFFISGNKVIFVLTFIQVLTLKYVS